MKRMVKRTCQAHVPSGKTFMGAPDESLCPACAAQFKKMYPDLEKTTMAKKSSKKNGVAKTAPKKATNTAPEPFGGLDMDDEIDEVEAAADDELEAVDVTDEVPTGDDTDDDDEPEEEAPPASGKMAAWAAKHPKRAARRLKNAVQRLEKFDWEAMGVPGIKGALAIMSNAIPQLEAKSTPRKTKISEGDVVRVTEKYLAKHLDQGVFAAEELRDLTVVRIVKRVAHCKNAINPKMVLPVGQLEVQSVMVKKAAEEARA